MAHEIETCPTCRRYTMKGREQLAVQSRSRPIYGTDLTKPLSEVVESIRHDLAKARGQISDISFGFTGWAEHLACVEGLLTCGLMALHKIKEDMREHEAKYPRAGTSNADVGT